MSAENQVTRKDLCDECEWISFMRVYEDGLAEGRRTIARLEQDGWLAGYDLFYQPCDACKGKLEAR